jgi:hypothetical protein
MKARLCPECGSGKISVATLLVESVAQEARCQNCGWHGKESELVAVNLNLPSEALVLQVAQSFLLQLSKLAAQPLGLAMVESGLVGVKDSKSIARLVRAACLGAHRATLEEIELMQKEPNNDPRN